MSTSAAPVVAARTVPAANGWQWNVDALTVTAGYRALFVVLVVALLVLVSVVDLIPIVGPFAAALLTPALTAGIVLGCDARRRGEALKFDHLFAGFERQAKKLLALGAVLAVANFVLGVLTDLIVAPGDLEALGESLPGVLLGGAAPDLDLIRDVLLRVLLATLVALALSIPLLMAVWFAIPLVALRDVDVLPAMKASFTACAENMSPFLVWSVPALLVTIVLVAPLSLAIAVRSLLLGLLSVLPLLLDFVLVAALSFASIYTSYRDVFALGELQ